MQPITKVAYLDEPENVYLQHQPGVRICSRLSFHAAYTGFWWIVHPLELLESNKVTEKLTPQTCPIHVHREMS